MLVNEQRIKCVKELRSEFQMETGDNRALALDDPLFKHESEYRGLKEELAGLVQKYKSTKKHDEMYLEELRIKHRAVMDKHIESYGREFSIKFNTDNDLAIKHLEISRDHYLRIKKLSEHGHVDLSGINRGSVEGQQRIDKLRKELNRKKEIISKL